ncbi:hypothetical protein D187_009468 [Cystobacter fuscus DSM 2262]|uniref:Uncharacterized protein n=1 Tax=Cystobacter fuscus (strain ATCC 25194 / DSM 2262 / NBRC 100088 / M29) TaxID=1242864 RepID=S9NWI1_CYSF2|nr:hypothetical protein D187_009468 [Cystobacter fuscus DSM 2262]
MGTADSPRWGSGGKRVLGHGWGSLIMGTPGRCEGSRSTPQ